MDLDKIHIKNTLLFQFPNPDLLRIVNEIKHITNGSNIIEVKNGKTNNRCLDPPPGS